MPVPALDAVPVPPLQAGQVLRGRPTLRPLLRCHVMLLRAGGFAMHSVYAHHTVVGPMLTGSSARPNDLGFLGGDVLSWCLVAANNVPFDAGYCVERTNNVLLKYGRSIYLHLCII